MPTLHVLQGPDKGRTYHTPNEPALIGRHCDQIPLSDNGASRRHAEIRRSNGTWVLTDLNSSNGTFVNGQRIINATPLKHGDQIKIATTLLVFSGDERVAGYPDGATSIRDLVDLDAGAASAGSSILAAINGSEESVILQPPETADAVAAWNVVYKVAEMVGTIESVDLFLERVADVLFDHLVVDHLVLLAYGAGGSSLKTKIVRFRRKDEESHPRILASRKIIKHVMDTKEGLLCANAKTDERFSSENPQDSIHQLGLRSVMCVPIVAHGEVYGVFHIDCSMTHHTYTQEQLRLAIAVSRLTGMAIENADLLESKMSTARLAATGETVAYLSHHIRNMLQGMQGGADVVELGLKNQKLDVAASGWELVRRNLDRIYQLTLNMLTFSKDRQPRIVSGQLNKVVEDAVSLSHGKADEKGVMLLAELDDMPAIPLDPDGVHQVTHNILLNAIEAAPKEKGRVNIRTAYDSTAGEAVLSISDNGCGIPPLEQARIFDPFQSAKGQAGTGLGLAAAKKIVSELEGRIEVESDEHNGGTTFRVCLPAVHVKLADSEKTHGPA